MNHHQQSVDWTETLKIIIIYYGKNITRLFYRLHNPYLGYEDALVALVPAEHGKVQHLLTGGPRERDTAWPGLGRACYVQQPQLSSHALVLQSRLKLLQELHHRRLRFKVGEVVVDPEQYHAGHPIPESMICKPAGERE